MFYTRIVCIAAVCCLAACTAQRAVQVAENYVPVSQLLYDTIFKMDSLLFMAFNSGDIETTKNIFSTDLEFYHDEGGLTDYRQTISNTQQLFERNRNAGLTRTLVPGSLRVYPIKNYGAIQTGQHRFCHVENGKNDCGTFRFTHIWRQTSAGYKLARVVSYDH